LSKCCFGRPIISASCVPSSFPFSQKKRPRFPLLVREPLLLSLVLMFHIPCDDIFFACLCLVSSDKVKLYHPPYACQYQFLYSFVFV